MLSRPNKVERDTSAAEFVCQPVGSRLLWAPGEAGSGGGGDHGR